MIKNFFSDQTAEIIEYLQKVNIKEWFMYLGSCYPCSRQGLSIEHLASDWFKDLQIQGMNQ